MVGVVASTSTDVRSTRARHLFVAERMSLRLALFALVHAGSAVAKAVADARAPHFHDGKMTPYEIGPPSILLSPADESRLAEGEALMQAIVQEDGVSRRLIMVKDIKAPPEVITGRLLDIDAYPRMIKGCDQTATYETTEDPTTGRLTIKTKYNIHALHMKFTCAPRRRRHRRAPPQTRALINYGSAEQPRLACLPDRPPDARGRPSAVHQIL